MAGASLRDRLDGSHGQQKWRFKQAAGGVLTAKQAPHRPGTAPAMGDRKKEANETFYLDLFGLSGNALFTRIRGVGTILNGD